MATYVIGDVQGCYTTLQRLLKAISFDTTDRLIFLGDVVNRGMQSLEVLRFIVENEDRVSMVLGNHDILAIALFTGAIKDRPHTMDALLNAPDAPKLIEWLRHQPLLIKHGDKIFVHAGILPSVSIDEALIQAEHVHEKLVVKDDAKMLLIRFYERRMGRESTEVKDQALEALFYLTLIRMCAAPGAMATYDGELARAPEGLTPWFMLRNDGEYQIYFGHWAALGLYHYKNYYCLDSGCVWGNQLTALRLEDHKVFSVDNSEQA